MNFQDISRHIGGWIFLIMLLPSLSFAQTQSKKGSNMKKANNEMNKKTETATFAAGCFWCIEEQFKQLDGVISVTSGYTGGTVANPTYKQVCTGTTGHAEACNIVYDPSKISYDRLLAAFFVAHDPTQLNRQGDDIGTQYRSAVFYHSEEQKKLADYYIKKLNEEKAYNKKIVTEVTPYGMFYKAEDYHQEYYKLNPGQGYCRVVIAPKIEKFREHFRKKLRRK